MKSDGSTGYCIAIQGIIHLIGTRLNQSWIGSFLGHIQSLENKFGVVFVPYT